MNLEAIGIINGFETSGITQNISGNDEGVHYISEKDIHIIIRGSPNFKIKKLVVMLTGLGNELINLLPERNIIESARNFAETIHHADISRVAIGKIFKDELFEIETVSGGKARF